MKIPRFEALQLMLGKCRHLGEGKCLQALLKFKQAGGNVVSDSLTDLLPGEVFNLRLHLVFAFILKGQGRTHVVQEFTDQSTNRHRCLSWLVDSRQLVDQ